VRSGLADVALWAPILAGVATALRRHRIRDWVSSRARLLRVLEGALVRLGHLETRLATAHEYIVELEEKLADAQRAADERPTLVLPPPAPLRGEPVAIADVLAERARANALAERVQLLQNANMAANRGWR
jgi:hypothetical protein